MTDIEFRTWYMTPESPEECAAHVENGGIVEERCRSGGPWYTSPVMPVEFREQTWVYLTVRHDYRLVYSAPVSMSPVPGSPGHAYGPSYLAPEEWAAKWCSNGEVARVVCFAYNKIIETWPDPTFKTERVPLTKIIGRRLVGFETLGPVYKYKHEDNVVGWWAGDFSGTFALDKDDCVEVLIEAEENM